jgi:hypothetical protein
MPGFRSGSDRDSGLKSGRSIGTAFNQARIGRADSSHVAPHVGKGGLNRRADQGGVPRSIDHHLTGPLPRATPAAGQRVPGPGPEAEKR